MKVITGYLMILLIWLLSRLPLGSAQAVGRLAGRLARWSDGAFMRVARINISLCFPQMTTAEQEQFIKEIFANTGMAIAEMGIMWARPPQNGLSYIRNVHNYGVFAQALAQGKGVLLLAPHLGNWELTNTYIASVVPLTAMYRPARNPVFDRWMHAHRERTGATLVPTSVGGIKALYRCLRQGGVVGFLPDQEPKPEGGHFAPFMGIPALTPTLPQQILYKTGARAVFVFARRLNDGKGFDIHFLPADEAIYSSDADTALTAMNQGVEACIDCSPQQYQWIYKRFKRRPDGGQNPYPR